MVPLEKILTTPKSPEHNSSPRISFSTDFLNDEDFISINPTPPTNPESEKKLDKGKSIPGDFAFLSNNNMSTQKMITADELFFEGKLLPFRQIRHVEKLSRISVKEKNVVNIEEEVFKRRENNNIIINKNSNNDNNNRVNWFIDEDPSPRPPSCTVLWKELLRLKKKKHAPSSLSPSSSSSSSSTAVSGDLPLTDEGKKRAEKGEKQVKGIKKGIERTRSGNIMIRPMVNVPVGTQGKSNGLPPLFSLKKGRLER